MIFTLHRLNHTRGTHLVKENNNGFKNGPSLRYSNSKIRILQPSPFNTVYAYGCWRVLDVF